MQIDYQKLGRPLVIGCVAAFVLMLMSLYPTVAQEPAQDQIPVISVTGTGSASGVPDLAIIDIGVEIQDANVGTAVERVNAIMDDVIAALSEAGIPEEDIRTTSFTVRQERPLQEPAAQQAENETEAFYVVSNIVEVRVSDIDQIANVIQTALDAGANRTYGLRFALENADSLLSEARQKAADDARMRAEELAEIFGVPLGNPVRIDESRGGGGIPVEQAAIGGGGGGPAISQGQLSVTMQLNVTYEIADIESSS